MSCGAFEQVPEFLLAQNRSRKVILAMVNLVGEGVSELPTHCGPGYRLISYSLVIYGHDTQGRDRVSGMLGALPGRQKPHAVTTNQQPAQHSFG